MNEAKPPVSLMFETSWEVCNKIGGIYAVLSTKAKTLQKLYKDRVIFVGPDVWTIESPSPYFVESKTLLKEWRRSLSLPEGVSVRVGRWLVPGKPIAVLVKFDGMYAVKDEFYGKMWNEYGVDSLHAYGDYDEACAFSHAAGIVIESIYKFYKGENQSVIAHFDEWTTGMGLLYIKSNVPEIATIFTTHATSIGRSICGNGKPLYDYLKGYNGDQMAAELNMQSKHSLEKAAANQADCFTTVSEVTAVECEQLLDIRPAVVTPNGFEKNFVPPKTKFAQCRKFARDKMLEVASALTGKQLTDNTFIIATSGRCEYRNKGIDMYLDAMKRLADRCGKSQVVSFAMVPAWSGDARFDLRAALHGKSFAGLPDPVITHSLHNYDSDPIISRIHQLGFENREGCVSVIYVPCYLNGEDGIFDATYYDLLIGMDATVFPSYYEPWGYTPLESIAFGVPTITTSLSGFGQWVIRSSESGFDNSGVTVVGRTDSNYDGAVEQIVSALDFLINDVDEKEKALISAKAFATADSASWKYFIKYYLEAFDIALKKCRERN